ncbi:unnamed protein product [marine sediment metagenome]|uniref:Uncharacterized protein n=1 Tax=marine sediment metagenome TaxID=412755 RepID=X0V153_9ZZZZ
MNGGESFRQVSPHGYRQLYPYRSGRQTWWLNAPAQRANVAPYADHLAMWPGLLNAAEKPGAGDREIPSNAISPDQLATALKAGFQEVQER